MNDPSESDIFWLLVLAQVGIVLTTNGLARLLAAGSTVGTLYLGSKKGLM